MSNYERRRWEELTAHWDRMPRRLLSPGAQATLDAMVEKGQDFAVKAGRHVANAMPEPVKQAGEKVVDATLAPTVKALTKLLDFTADLVTEFSTPDAVFKYHRANGHDIQSLEDLRNLDLKELDNFTRRMSLRWRAVGVVEGGALGGVAMLPGPGTFASITLDVLISQALTAAIASRVAYAYGFDATDPDQQKMIERMVRRAYREVAPKASAMHQAGEAFKAGQGRIRWSDKLRQDQKLIAALEKLMTRFQGSPVPVQKVVGKIPVISVVTAAGLNQHMLADVAKQARLYAATVFLAEKYGLPLPTRLREASEVNVDDESQDNLSED